MFITMLVASFIAQASLFQMLPRRIKYFICAFVPLAVIVNIVGSLGIKALFGETYGIGIANLIASALFWGYIIAYGWWEGVHKTKVWKVIPWATTDKEEEEKTKKYFEEKERKYNKRYHE